MIKSFSNALFRLLTKNKMYVHQLEKLVKTVNDYLEELGVQVPFFVAGGSVYSVINDNNVYDDIDVFFYTQEDCDAVINKLSPDNQSAITFEGDITTITCTANSYVTSNAVTVPSLAKSPLRRQIQFVKLHVGDVHDVMSTFDFNCSKVAYTSQGEFVKSVHYTTHITVDEKNINGMVLERYHKYKSKKNCKDDDNVTYKQIIRYLINNCDVRFDTGYKAQPCITGTELLENAIRNDFIEIAQAVHDYIQSKDVPTRLNIFSKLPALLDKEIKDMSDELYLFLLLRSIKMPQYKCTDKQEVRLKYAEYFI